MVEQDSVLEVWHWWLHFMGNMGQVYMNLDMQQSQKAIVIIQSFS